MNDVLLFQVEQDASVSDASPHIVNIGRLVEVSLQCHIYLSFHTEELISALVVNGRLKRLAPFLNDSAVITYLRITTGIPKHIEISNHYFCCLSTFTQLDIISRISQCFVSCDFFYVYTYILFPDHI